MHIYKYKIVSIDYSWKNGKQSKNTSVQQEMISKECIIGKTFIQLLTDIDDAWHQHGECKDCEIEVTFKPHNYKND